MDAVEISEDGQADGCGFGRKSAGDVHCGSDSQHVGNLWVRLSEDLAGNRRSGLFPPLSVWECPLCDGSEI